MLDLVTRADAKAAGLKRYFTGKPCKHGHVAERQVSKATCVRCSALGVKLFKEAHPEKVRDYYILNKAHISAKSSVWRQRNPERARLVEREWRERNSERVSTIRSIWKHQNSDRCKQYSASYNNSHPGKRAAISKVHKIKRDQRLVSWAHQEKIDEIYKEAYQLTNSTGIPHHVDHIYPLNGKTVSGLHVHQNLQILTKADNLIKSNRMPDLPEAAADS